MRNKKVLLCYSAPYGYVTEISLEISKILEENGLITHLIDLKKIRSSKWPSLDEYDAILTGSSAGDVTVLGVRWQGTVLRKELKNFFTLKLEEIIKNKKILGVFKSDPFNLGPIIFPEHASDSLEEKILTKYGFKPSICAQFGPVIDFSRKSRLKADPKKELKKIVKPIMKKTGLEFHMKGFNDFRDWERIREFSIKFAEMVGGSTISSEEGKTCPNCGIKVDPSWKFCNMCKYKLL